MSRIEGNSGTADAPRATQLTNVSSIAQNTPAENIPAQNIPEDERRFISIIQKYQSLSGSAANDMVLGGLRHRRKTELCKILPQLHVDSWIGKVKELSSNSDGNGVLYISVADDITIATSNNSFSDSLMPSPTLIEPESTIFTSAASMAKGDTIRFSGNFFKTVLSAIS